LGCSDGLIRLIKRGEDETFKEEIAQYGVENNGNVCLMHDSDK